MSKLHDDYVTYKDAMKNNAPNSIVASHKTHFLQTYQETSPDDLEQPDSKGYTLLAYAIIAEDIVTISDILTKIKRFDRTPDYYCNELRFAIMLENKKITRLLLDHGAKIDQTHPDLSFTRLELAAINANPGEIPILLASGAHFDPVLFKYAFESEEVKEDKIAVLNLLFLWSWSNNIKVDLSDIAIPLGITDGMIVLNAFTNRSAISRRTQHFENALCTIEEIIKSAQKPEQKSSLTEGATHLAENPKQKTIVIDDASQLSQNPEQKTNIGNEYSLIAEDTAHNTKVTEDVSSIAKNSEQEPSTNDDVSKLKTYLAENTEPPTIPSSTNFNSEIPTIISDTNFNTETSTTTSATNSQDVTNSQEENPSELEPILVKDYLHAPQKPEVKVYSIDGSTQKTRRYFTYEQVYLAIKRRIEGGDDDIQLIKQATQIKKLWEQEVSRLSLVNATLFYMASDLSFFKSKPSYTHLPEHLKEAAEDLAKEFEISPKSPALNK